MKEECTYLDLIASEWKAFNKLERDKEMAACTISAGFLTGRKNREYQVFVKVIRYSDELLKKKPITGGLLANP